MANITTDLIKMLRAKTGVGMMDCKKALIESNGDLEKAEEFLRKKGVSVAAKRAGNETNNGRVEGFVDTEGRAGALIEVACETDFAANTADLKNFAKAVAKQVATSDKPLKNQEALLAAKNDETGQPVQIMLDSLISKIAEKVTISRITSVHTDANGLINVYIHPGSQLGVIVDIKANKEISGEAQNKVVQLAKDICMHIAVMNPSAVDSAHLGTSLVAKEMEIAREQLLASGKPEQIIEKILIGKKRKLCEEVCLINQKFIKNDKISIQNHINSVGKEIGLELSIKDYRRFGIGR